MVNDPITLCEKKCHQNVTILWPVTFVSLKMCLGKKLPSKMWPICEFKCDLMDDLARTQCGPNVTSMWQYNTLRLYYSKYTKGALLITMGGSTLEMSVISTIIWNHPRQTFLVAAACLPARRNIVASSVFLRAWQEKIRGVSNSMRCITDLQTRSVDVEFQGNRWVAAVFGE